MVIAELPTARERHFREMAVWHEWPIAEKTSSRFQRPNVAPTERAVSAVMGGMLLAYGLSKRTVPAWIAAAIGAGLVRRGATGRCGAYRALGVNTARQGSAQPEDYYENGIQVAKAVTINASPEMLYTFWRNFSNLPQIMSHVKAVDVIDELHSHWVVEGPLGSRIEWDAQIINEEPYELIAWRSLPGAAVDNAGSVRFIRAPGGRGTQVRVNIEYIPVAGRIGAAVAKLFGREPNQEVREDLRRFKQVMEAGETPTTIGQPVGQCAATQSEGGRT